jgi:pyruvate/2-oxoacid:ferredoxin oxidoreductase alpha subunit
MFAGCTVAMWYPITPSSSLVETMIEKSYSRGLPVQQADAAWISIYNGFKTA